MSEDKNVIERGPIGMSRNPPPQRCDEHFNNANDTGQATVYGVTGDYIKQGKTPLYQTILAILLFGLSICIFGWIISQF